MLFLFNFKGRINARQWWLGHLLLLAIIVTLHVMWGIFAASHSYIGADDLPAYPFMVRLGETVVTLLLVGCGFAGNYRLTTMRLRDRNKAPSWYWASFIPVIGVFWQVFECGFLPSYVSSERSTAVTAAMSNKKARSKRSSLQNIFVPPVLVRARPIIAEPMPQQVPSGWGKVAQDQPLETQDQSALPTRVINDWRDLMPKNKVLAGAETPSMMNHQPSLAEQHIAQSGVDAQSAM